MLVLKRRKGEAIVVDGGIRIVLLDSDKRGARIGIEAPSETSIKREELVDDVAAENRQAGARESRNDLARALPLGGQPL